MRNLTLLTDLYQLTMMQGYIRENKQERAVFDLYFRAVADFSAYALACGLETALDYIENLRFTHDDIAYLWSQRLFDEEFLAYLKSFCFTGDIDAMPEGTVCFPGEPLLRVTAPLPQAQLLETALLNIINHQTLIATKASRVVHAAAGGQVLEFGLRRAQGPDAGLYGSRASIIGGCVATSNVLAGRMFDVEVSGTHAHSWVMSFDSELEAFRAYARAFPKNCLLLVDTYDSIKSGIPNAIKVFEELRASGREPVGIRLDSGDLAYLSKRARIMLDEAGFPDTRIVASGDLDEDVIWDLRAQGARIDTWGVGTRLITSRDHPALGGVYKLAALEKEGRMRPVLKHSDSPNKRTTPGEKQVWRLYERTSGMATADLVTLADETVDDSQPLTIFSPEEPYKRMTLNDFAAKALLQPCIVGGKRVLGRVPLTQIASYAKLQLDTLWEEYRRLRSPHVYKVDLSQKLYDLRRELLYG